MQSPWPYAERFFIYGEEILQADSTIAADGSLYVSCLAPGMERTFVLFADIADATFFETRDQAQLVLERIDVPEAAE